MCFLNMMSISDLRASIIRSNHTIANITIALKLKIRANATLKKKL